MATIKHIKTANIDITLKDYSKEMQKEIRKACKKGLREIAKPFKNIVKATVRATAYRTGLLYRSIGYQVTATASGDPWLKIGAKNTGSRGGSANHAHWVHNGTGPRYNKTQKHSTGQMKPNPFLNVLEGHMNDAVKSVETQLAKINIGG